MQAVVRHALPGPGALAGAISAMRPKDMVVQAGLIDAAPLVTHMLPLAKAQAACDLASDRTRAIKVQIVFTAEA